MLNKDKIYHFLAGAIIVVPFGMVDLVYGLIAGFFIAIMKETYDYTDDKHTVDGMDFISTVVGSLSSYSLLVGFGYG